MVKIKKYKWWIITLLWMGLIFCFSQQTATDSGALSTGLSSSLIRELQRFCGTLNWDLKEVEFLLRKSAHFFNYMILGVLLYFSLKGTKWSNAAVIAVIFSGFYAASDEFHQLFISGRSAQIRDILIDTAGAATGVLIIKGIEYLKKRLVRMKNN